MNDKNGNINQQDQCPILKQAKFAENMFRRRYKHDQPLLTRYDKSSSVQCKVIKKKWKYLDSNW